MSSNVPLNQIIIPTNASPTRSINDYTQMILNAPLPSYTPRAPQVPEISDEENEQRITELLSNIKQQPPAVSEMQIRDGNILRNALREGREISTGLTYMWTHAPELLGEGVANIRDFYSGYSLPENIARTIDKVAETPQGLVNTVLSPYNIDLEDFGTRSARDIIGGAIEGAVHNPISTFTDALSLGLGSAAVRGLRNVPQLGRLAKGMEVEKALASEGVKVTRDINKLDDTLQNVNKLAKDNNVNLSRVIEAAETGVELGKNEKVVFKELKKFSQEYDDFASKYATTEVAGAEETAIVQKILRDRLKVNPEMTYEQVRREVVPILQSGEKITDLAKEGNIVAREVAGAKALYDKGRIFPVTHALANVERTTSTVASGISGLADAERAGRFANRLWGTSSYEDIAKELSKPENFLKDLTDKYLDKQVSTSILEGAFGTPVEGAKNLRYLDKGLLEQGRTQEALKGMRKERLLSTDIALDADIAKELEKQVGRTGSAYSNFVNEVYQTGKSAMLAQGTYLGANAITGAAQAITNSGAFIINDIIDAVRSQGRLAKEVGVFRRGGKPNFSQTPLARQIQQANYYTGGKALSGADRWMQNKFAEIAAHAELRKAGIPYAQRLEALTNADKIDLGQLIVDMKRAALINSSNTGLVSKGLAETLSAVNPFYRWNITATQATARMLEKSPLVSNVILLDILSNIGFDREMQNRLNLGVTLDKPYVSFKMDKNGNMRQMNAEFVPITTSIKTFDIPENTFSTTVPIIGTIFNSAQGIDKYGKPMKRAVSPDGVITQTVGTKRMQYDPRTGRLEPIGGQADEIFNNAVKTLVGAPNLYNRTIGPLLSPVFGEGGQFYQPYNQSLLGSFSRSEQDNNLIVGGNALRGRSAQDVINILSGVYETPYYNSEDRVTPSQQRRFFRGYARDLQRRAYEE